MSSGKYPRWIWNSCHGLSFKSCLCLFSPMPSDNSFMYFVQHWQSFWSQSQCYAGFWIMVVASELFFQENNTKLSLNHLLRWHQVIQNLTSRWDVGGNKKRPTIIHSGWTMLEGEAWAMHKWLSNLWRHYENYI